MALLLGPLQNNLGAAPASARVHWIEVEGSAVRVHWLECELMMALRARAGASSQQRLAGTRAARIAGDRPSRESTTGRASRVADTIG